MIEAEAAMLLGSMYLQGDGVAKDTGLALQGLRRTILVRRRARWRERTSGLVKRYQAEVSHLLVHAALVPRCFKARIPLMLESEGPFELPTTLLPRTALK